MAGSSAGDSNGAMSAGHRPFGMIRLAACHQGIPPRRCRALSHRLTLELHAAKTKQRPPSLNKSARGFSTTSVSEFSIHPLIVPTLKQKNSSLFTASKVSFF